MANEDVSATIVKEVERKIQAAVLGALAGDEIIGQYVRAALMQPVPLRGYGSSERGPFLTQLIFDAIQAATKTAVEALVVERSGDIEQWVREALAGESGAALARALIDGLVRAAAEGWRFQVSLTLPEIGDED